MYMAAFEKYIFAHMEFDLLVSHEKKVVYKRRGLSRMQCLSCKLEPDICGSRAKCVDEMTPEKVVVHSPVNEVVAVLFLSLATADAGRIDYGAVYMTFQIVCGFFEAQFRRLVRKNSRIVTA